MIWDGECHFCARWIERWKQETGGRVDYITSQELGDRFPEIPRESFSSAVFLIEPGGEVFRAAEAVYRSLGASAYVRWLKWSYYHLPGFAAISETAYGLIAKHRQAASAVTRLLWGRDVRVPTYYTAGRLFLRALGVVYLIAFISLWVQIDGLIGANGVAPVREFLPAAHAQLGAPAPYILPTLCWLSSSDAALHLLCGAGAAISVLLIIGFAPLVSVILLFVLYLSLSVAGQTFLEFQWDILLLEAGFLSIFLAPARLWLKTSDPPPMSRVGLLLLRLLLFKLMFLSGLVKLTSGDDSWWNLTALDYHYWTQPLPTFLSWWAAQTSEWLKHFCTAAVLIVETLVPFLICAPRRPRFLAFILLVTLQIMIALTGNYCFFNLLTLALCLLLLDDHPIGRRAFAAHGKTRGTLADFLNLCAGTVLIVTLPINAMLVYSGFKPAAVWPRPIAMLYSSLAPFRIVNGYGLFRVMTKTRPEIIVEGSNDGFVWKAYEFKWKPGRLDRAPAFVAPHQPRLDWQMWFAALGTYQENPWFVRFMQRLLQNAPAVTDLLATNPFPKAPPRYVRATLFEYHFTNREEHGRTGEWWKRERMREYFPEVSLESWQR